MSVNIDDAFSLLPIPPSHSHHHICSISTELQDRISKIDRLRKRYEIITVSMQPPEGEEQSQAYYVIKVGWGGGDWFL